MATAQKSRGGKVRDRRVGGVPGLQPRRLWPRLVLALLVIAAALLAWFWRPLTGRARAASAVAARVACSCHFVAGRALSSCHSDFEPGMGPVMLGEDSEARSITARYAFLFPQTATYRGDEGCVLEKWKK